MGQWSTLRETYGIYGDSAHSVGRLISAHPDLRGLLPSEIAVRLNIDPDKAQEGVLVLAAECFPDAKLLPDESFDSLVILNGTYAPPVELEGDGETLRTSANVTGRARLPR